MHKTEQIHIFKKDKERLDNQFLTIFLNRNPLAKGLELTYAYKIEKLLNYYIHDDVFKEE